MFRKPFVFPRRHRDEVVEADPNSSDDEIIRPLALERTQSSATSSVADRSVKDPLGLKVLYRPPKERKVDIIFVHGLGGSSRMTWTKDHNLDNFWPLKFLPHEPEIGDARIMTFGYNAKFKPGSSGSSTISVLDFAKELLYDLKYATDESSPELEDLRLGQKPIIFLVHSMGGLIVKEAYMQGKDDPEYAAIIKAISSIIFLSTPHRGTNLAETLNRILRVSLVAKPMQFISELTSGSQTLQKLNESFRHVAEKLQIISFYETHPTPIIKSATSIMVLEKESSVLGYPGEISKPLDADHNGVCKYDGPDDPRYITIRNALKSLVAKSNHREGREHTARHASSDSSSSSNGSDFIALDRDRYRGGSRRASTKEEPTNAPGTGEAAKANLRDYLSSAESPNQDFNFFRDRWTVGTCEWIFSNQAFTTWLEDDRTSPHVLWLQGNAAGGKSIMSSFIIDKLARGGLPCYYFFFRFNDQKKRSIGTLLRSLAAQMANSIPTYAYKLLDVASVTTDLKAADFRSIWQWFFKDTLFALGEEVGNPIYWVMDGLDEADTPSSLIRLLADIDAATVKIPLRILIVSRKTHDLSSAFVRLGKRIDMDTIWIEGYRQDLLAYVEQEMDFTEEGEYRDQVVAQLLERTGGNFLWLHLAVHKINQCHTKLDVERALEDLPSGMHELYDRMALLVQNQPKASDRRLGQSILGWATCARRSLSIEELKDALGGTSDMREIVEIHRTVEDLCGGFVVVDNEGKIAMLHETAREYLTGSALYEISGRRPCAIDPRRTHDLLFKRCIACLTDPSLRNLINRGEPPALLNYAISSWYIHLSKGTCVDPNPEILDVVVRFLRSPHVLVWMFSAATQNELRFLVIASRYLAGVVLGLRQIQDEGESLAQRQATEVIEGWATDLIKIVGKFGKNLTRDPDSIYRRIPPFCPSPSMIYQQFGKKESRTLHVSGVATTRWDDCLARFSFESGAVASTVLNAGSRLVILTIDRRTSTIATYSDATFGEQRRMQHAERVLMIQVNKLGNLLVSYGYKTTRIWDVATGACIKVANNPATLPRPQAITFVQDEILMSSEDRCVRSLSISDESSVEWELKSRVEEQGQVLDGIIANAPSCAAISHDGRMVAYGYRGHPITVWEIDPTVFFSEIVLDADGAIDMLEASSMRWHPLRYEIFCLSNVGVLFKWDPDYDQAEFTTHSGADKLNINPNGSLVVTGDARGNIKVYASADLSLLCHLHSQDNIVSLSFSSDSRRLYDVRSLYGIVWEPSTLVRLAEKSEYPESNTDLGFTGDNESLAKLSLYSEHTSAHFDSVVSLARQPVGSLYCYATEDGVAMLGEVGKGNVGELARSASYLAMEHIVWSEDGRLVVLSDLGGRLLFKRVTRSSNKCNIQHEHDLVIPPSHGHITQLVVHPSGDRLLAATPTTLHCVKLKTWEINAKTCPVGVEPQIKWACHPTMPDYILGFSRTRVRIVSWATLDELGVRTYALPRATKQQAPGPGPTTTSHGLLARANTLKSDRDKLGRLISGQGFPQILFETHLAGSGEATREFLVFEAADITPSPDDAATGLSYTTLPEHVASRIREPLAFLPRGKLAYLDVDAWICTFRLSMRPTLGVSRRVGSLSSSSLPQSSGSTDSQSGRRLSETLSRRRGSLQITGTATERVVTARRHGSESAASGSTSGIERHYFLPGDWATANEAYLCAMAPDGTLLCPQNGGIASVQSATLRK
ncbi:vegetative incompatibility protein HET-E-1 [Trichoderma asperellum]|uniref:Vegetative incompatibility protein HET-E-1 n=1 Tax=Trichoderma asperellum TaxID=101201 RepID=A0A6V8R5C0_TRIAP|nr:vegetative incompatibility protein HET-E-1 [Trichoderma asperellum]